jgi:hypothetical protein
MTLRVPVLLLTAILLGGVVESRADCVNYLEFPSPFTHNTTWVAYGTCIQDPARYDAGGRLRWGDNNNGQLQLFDTDDHGQLIWCGDLRFVWEGALGLEYGRQQRGRRSPHCVRIVLSLPSHDK